jgi:hypothetical protein
MGFAFAAAGIWAGKTVCGSASLGASSGVAAGLAVDIVAGGALEVAASFCAELAFAESACEGSTGDEPTCEGFAAAARPTADEIVAATSAPAASAALCSAPVVDCDDPVCAGTESFAPFVVAGDAALAILLSAVSAGFTGSAVTEEAATACAASAAFSVAGDCDPACSKFSDSAVAGGTGGGTGAAAVAASSDESRTGVAAGTLTRT